MSKHTPGPWRAEYMPKRDGLICVFPNNNLSVADCCDMEDARLIAAAPDLLDALQMAKAWVAQYHNTPGHDAASRCMSAVIDAAIAKATGDAA